MQKLYTAKDMAKIGCDGCRGCSFCCEGMGDTVVLNPYDVYELTKNLQVSVEDMLNQKIELHVEEGMILPHIKMSDKTDKCVFLNEEKRCSIHPFRPGLCRLFPLGRNYDSDGEMWESKGYRYFVLEEACPKAVKTKVKIDKWLSVNQLSKNEAFILDWHNFCRWFQNKLQKLLSEGQDDYAKQLNMLVLNQFFMKPYEAGLDFYEQYDIRMKEIKGVVR